MKNISRRVFIKGLAVAGVAAAASTVLAGCNTNMIPGVDDGEGEVDDVPSTSAVLEYTDKDDSNVKVKISALSMVLGSEPYGKEAAAIKLKVVNDLGAALPVLETVPAGVSAATSVTANVTKVKVGDYYVFAEAFSDGNEADELDISTANLDLNLAYKNTTTPDNAPADGKTSVGYIYLNGVKAKESVSLKLTLKKCTAGTTASAYVNDCASQTFTFKV